ncbi:immunity protein Imm33 domain-containing protein [Chitinophaga sp. RAB17]|uniref:immunity protein Imm33 domain-containing protein n=1 Tax=Chitinophaga sp. RAB17 TaxID=3233049 RepID=UPI003F91728E
MEKSYYIQDVTIDAAKNPRHFTIPTENELANLKVGEKVRLFFVFNFPTDDGCRAERMWVELSETNGDKLKGYLTNQPHYIKDLSIGEVIEFEKKHIATTIIKRNFDEKKKAIITRKALTEKEVNWLMLGEPNNPEDSGWQLFYGDEDESYLNDYKNAAIITLEEVLSFEPRLEKAFMSNHRAFEWDADENDFTEVHDFNGTMD